eukprot:COSAG06_NODE_18246_length_896_cov_1.511920_1_plen_160_part_01
MAENMYLTWCDWEAIQSEVWCCHVNWECCGHWRASPFHIAQRKLQQPKRRLEAAQGTGPGGVLRNTADADDPRRSLARQVPALSYAYTLAAQGRIDVLCEALLSADSTAVPVAQALASAPRTSVGAAVLCASLELRAPEAAQLCPPAPSVCKAVVVRVTN